MFNMANQKPIKASFNRDEIKGEARRFELYIGNMDHTWSDGTYVYTPLDTERKQAKEDALWCLQADLDENKQEVAFIGVYSVEEDQEEIDL